MLKPPPFQNGACRESCQKVSITKTAYEWNLNPLHYDHSNCKVPYKFYSVPWLCCFFSFLLFIIYVDIYMIAKPYDYDMIVTESWKPRSLFNPVCPFKRSYCLHKRSHTTMENTSALVRVLNSYIYARKVLGKYTDHVYGREKKVWGMKRWAWHAWYSERGRYCAWDRREEALAFF